MPMHRATPRTGRRQQTTPKHAYVMDGPVSLLAQDPWGRLGGSEWGTTQASLAMKHGRSLKPVRRDRPPDESSVGQGKSKCRCICALPIALKRIVTHMQYWDFVNYGNGVALSALTRSSYISSMALLTIAWNIPCRQVPTFTKEY